MTSLLSNYFGNKILTNNFVESVTYLSLHTSDPGVTGETSTEVIGGGYTRELITWTAATSKTTANSNSLVFNDLNAVTITHIAVWTTSTAGTMLIRFELPFHVTMQDSGNFVVSPGDVAFTI